MFRDDNEPVVVNFEDMKPYSLCPSCREALINGRRAIDFLKRFLDDCRDMPREAPGHMCRYRVVLEALAQRAKEVGR
jgi:hypothetical protein